MFFCEMKIYRFFPHYMYFSTMIIVLIIPEEVVREALFSVQFCIGGGRPSTVQGSVAVVFRMAVMDDEGRETVGRTGKGERR